MNDKCGLVNASNPCRCQKKTAGFMRAGYVDPRNLLFARDRIRRVREVAPRVSEAIATLDARCAAVYREHPFYEPPDVIAALKRLIESPEFTQATDPE